MRVVCMCGRVEMRSVVVDAVVGYVVYVPLSRIFYFFQKVLLVRACPSESKMSHPD